VYNQRDLRLVKLYPKWQSVERFIKYRRLPYTENDFVELNFDPTDIIICSKFGIMPPVWVFEYLWVHVQLWELFALLTREKLNAMRKTNIVYLGCEHKAFFKKVGIWEHVLKIIIGLQIECGDDCWDVGGNRLIDSILNALPQCEFIFTPKDLNRCKTRPSKYAIIFDQIPPIWFLDILFKNGRRTITMERQYYSVKKLLATSQ